MYSYPGNRFPPPLSLDVLALISARHACDRDVVTLLWEIWRLQNTVLAAGRFLFNLVDSQGAGVDLIVYELRMIMDDEPCVQGEASRRTADGTSEPEPLTLEELKVMRDGNRGKTPQWQLLWEICRLQRVLHRVDQLQRSVIAAEASSLARSVLDLRRRLDAEPAVIQRRSWVQELIGAAW